jgi:dienelactone hydrolase
VTYERAGATTAPTGRVTTFASSSGGGSIKLYIAGEKQGESTASKPVVILVHDILSWGGGRTHHIADEIARDCNVLVIAPDLFGDNYHGIIDRVDLLYSPISGVSAAYSRMSTPWSQFEKMLFEDLLPFIHQQFHEGSNKSPPMAIGGFCFGGWIAFNACVSGKFACGFGFHPSPRANIFQVVERIKCPLLLLLASSDSKDLRPDGEILKILHRSKVDPTIGTRCKSVLYDTVPHGFANRGDIRDPKMKIVVEDAMKEAKEFLYKNLHEDPFVPKLATEEELEELRAPINLGRLHRILFIGGVVGVTLVGSVVAAIYYLLFSNKITKV